jgi:hypothetical protein
MFCPTSERLKGGVTVMGHPERIVARRSGPLMRILGSRRVTRHARGVLVSGSMLTTRNEHPNIGKRVFDGSCDIELLGF